VAKIRKVFGTEKKMAGNLCGFLPKWVISRLKVVASFRAPFVQMESSLICSDGLADVEIRQNSDPYSPFVAPTPVCRYKLDRISSESLYRAQNRRTFAVANRLQRLSLQDNEQ